MRKKNEEMTSPHLKDLVKDLAKVQKAKKYLENEREKLLKEEEKLRSKIKNEKEILNLKRRISKIKHRKV